MSIFKKEFFSSLSENPYIATGQLYTEVEGYFYGPSDGFEIKDTLEIYGLLQLFCKSYGFDSPPPLSLNDGDNHQMVSDYLDHLFEFTKEKRDKALVEQARNKYEKNFDKALFYEFSDDDYSRLQTLINEARELIVKSDLMDVNHKDRLLRKLESLQSELHKRVSDISKFWDLFGEAGVNIGKFGKNIKPLTDRFLEITKIGWRAQARAEELPSDSPIPFLELQKLSNPEASETD